MVMMGDVMTQWSGETRGRVNINIWVEGKDWSKDEIKSMSTALTRSGNVCWRSTS